MNAYAAPAQLVQQQLDAYNARDLDAWLATYAPDAKQFDYGGDLLASGREAIGQRMLTRFADPNLHARLIHRAHMGNVVIDHERVTRSEGDSVTQSPLIAIYDVQQGLIQRATFVMPSAVMAEVSKPKALWSLGQPWRRWWFAFNTNRQHVHAEQSLRRLSPALQRDIGLSEGEIGLYQSAEVMTRLRQSQYQP